MALLEARQITKRFGGLMALNGLDFHLEEGMIAGLIGPNGAGKTTFFNMITGLYRPSSGRLVFAGRDITGRRPNRIARLGISRTFQTIRLFGHMTVLDNVLVGMHCRLRASWLGAIVRPPWVVREEQHARRRAQELLDYVGLGHRGEDLARNLPYGDQRLLEIARALATEPRLLLLDEPSAGMNPHETDALTAFIARLRQDLGLSILLIEHHMEVVMGISDRVTVLNYGARLAEGAPRNIQRDPQVIEAYLGTGERSTLLVLQTVHSAYGNIHALRGISLTVERGEVVTLIGSNGAGKTTTLRTIMGLLVPRAGQITLDGQRIEGLATDRIVRLGIAQSPEGRRIFPRMSVLENLEMGAFARRDRHQIPSDLEHVYSLFPRLKERRHQRAGTLSGGEQQMLAMGRALMARPKVLLLDEPSMGLAPIFVETIFAIIRTINAEGTTILLVEQNARMALQVAHRGYVLQSGEMVLHDTAAALRRSDVVRKSYLGEK